MKDANGTEITIGARVKHLYPPMKNDDIIQGKTGNHTHRFYGTSEVVRFTGTCIEVKPVGRYHIPVHCPELLVVEQST